MQQSFKTDTKERFVLVQEIWRNDHLKNMKCKKWAQQCVLPIIFPRVMLDQKMHRE